LFGGWINAGECYGAEAAQYWADLHVKTGNPLYAIPGALAALWTPSTSDATLGVLSMGYGAAGVAASARNIPEWVASPVLYEFGQKTLSNSAYAALSGLSAAEREAAIVSSGLINAVFNLSGNWAQTWGAGPTPGASFFLLGGGLINALLGGSEDCECDR